MNRPAAKLDVVAFVRATNTAADIAADHLSRAARLAADAQAAERVQEGLCPTCFYLLGNAGGASVTHQPCGLCGEDQSYGSTATDVLCLDCANDHSLCKRCGGDRAMRIRRRKWPSQSNAQKV